MNIDEEFLLLKRIELGARLKVIRTDKDLTMDKVAELTGLSKPHISRIESGKYNFNYDTLVLFSVALAFDIDLVLK